MLGSLRKWMGRDDQGPFAVPTRCERGPAVRRSKSAGAKDLHADDWRQIEFVAQANAEDLDRRLAELEFFKKANETDGGWTQVYVRPEYAVPLAVPELVGGFAQHPLTVGGDLVDGGFAFADPDSDWFVYGQGAVLALSPGDGAASERFAEWISELATSQGMLLVDWYGVRRVDTSAPDAVSEWTAGYGS